MQINKVTITGADDNTDIQSMLAIQERFPFVEWGILVSQKQMGNHRFPSADWLSKLTPHQNDLQTSIHICGEWVRQICNGNWFDISPIVWETMKNAQRIQLNFHAYAHLLDKSFFTSAHNNQIANRWQLIFQIDGVNDNLFTQTKTVGLNAVPLYDLSGGAGVLPPQWPKQLEGIYTGYAGGLGPHNIIEQIEKIKNVANGQIWIDMETRVRTEDNSKLDEQLVTSVLEQCSHIIDV